MNNYHKKFGVKPGTVIYTGTYTDEKTSLVHYSYNSNTWNEQSTEMFEKTSDQNLTNWYRMTGFNNVEIFQNACDTFKIPILMQEDIAHTRQRSKLEIAGDKSLTVLVVPRIENDTIVWQQISIFHHENNVVTFGERKCPSFELIADRLKTKQGQIRDCKDDYLLYALIDSVVDQYLNVVSFMINEVDDLEIDLLNTTGKIPKGFVQELYSRKKDLLTLLKRINQTSTMIQHLRAYFEKHDNLDQAYLTDLEDHVSRIRDNLTHLRQLLTELMNQYLAMNSDHMNEIMKTLTIFSAIFIPLGFIAGLYGMNFNGETSPFNMPELNFKYGYFTVLFIMAGFVGGLLYYFRRRNWL